jgi:hypothetical protein
MIQEDLPSLDPGPHPPPTFTTGENLLKWIDAYSNANGNQRSCWLGRRKKLVCMSWEQDDMSDEEGEEGEEGEDDDDDDEEEEEEGYVEGFVE